MAGARDPEHAATHVHHLLDVALTAVVRGAPIEALRTATAAAALAEACAAHHAAADAHGFAARVAHAAADFEAARGHFANMASALSRAGDEVGVWGVELAIAFVHYDEGDAARATAILDDVARRATTAGRIEALRGRILGYRGNLARQRGDLQEARAHYREAIAACSAAGDDTFARVFAMDDAIAALLAGESADAYEVLVDLLRRAHASPHGLQRLFTQAIVAHYVALARLIVGVPAVPAVPTGPSPGAAVLPSLQSAHDAVTALGRTPSLSALRALPQATEHARLSALLLRRLTETAAQPRVLVARDGGKLVSGSDVVDLTRRTSLRRIVAALAEAACGGLQALPLRSIIAAGWPGEAITEKAARNRAHVALATLRRLGLDVALRQTDDGYRFDAEHVTIVGSEL